jgi:uncharacterized membrane protein YheB (UPF0754 family)
LGKGEKMRITKSEVTYFVSALVCALGWFFPLLNRWLFPIGAYAVAGAVTNGLAVHMLFEKVPLLYGSGVIQLQFESFKAAIKNLIMEQFFNQHTLEKHWRHAAETQLKNLVTPELMERLPLETLFDDLVETISASPLGMMLQMAGGAAALEPLREPVVTRLRESVVNMLSDPKVINLLLENNPVLVSESSLLAATLEKMIDSRLDELTPQIVKEIVQKMIHEHLGWLVVWGGFFGGLMGLLMTLIQPAT